MSTGEMFPAMRLLFELRDEGRGVLIKDDRVCGALLCENARRQSAAWDEENGFGRDTRFQFSYEDDAMQAITYRVIDAVYERERQENAKRVVAWHARMAVYRVARIGGVLNQLFPVVPAVPQRMDSGWQS